MSSPRQEDSIDRQRANITPYAARKGYVLTDQHTYTDEAIAGDEFEKRAGLQALLRDAAAGRFDVILCDEVSRLSRQDFTEFVALVAHPLKLAGVTLDTVSEGPLGWEEVADLPKLTVHQTTAAGESRKLSYRTLTGLAALATRGRLLGGARPFGYKVEYETVSIPGKPPKVVPLRLVPDGFKAEIVKYIFKRYDEGATVQEILAELNRRCPAAGGGRWSHGGLNLILKNIRYTGALTWNMTTEAKHHSFAGGRAVKSRRRRQWNDRADWVIVEGTHEAIVDRTVFDRVQDRLRNNRNGRDRSRRGGYILSGLTQCGHCGRTLCGSTRNGRIVYACERRDRTGAVVCASRCIGQDVIVRTICRVLRRAFLDPTNLADLRAEIARQARADRAPTNLAGLRKRIAELNKHVEQGRKNLVILPADMVPGVVEAMRAMEREKAGLEAEIERIEADARAADFEATVERAENVLWRLEDAAAGADPTHLRDVLRQTVERVVIRWDDHKAPSGRPRPRVVGGVIHYRPGVGAQAVIGVHSHPHPPNLPRTPSVSNGKGPAGATRPVNTSEPGRRVATRGADRRPF
jgi:DNA invertase Pin-like site-specific DNA recombinase